MTPGPALHEAESPGRVCWGLGGHTVTDKGAAASAGYEPGAETRARSGEAGASGWARRLWDDPGRQAGSRGLSEGSRKASEGLEEPSGWKVEDAGAVMSVTCWCSGSRWRPGCGFGGRGGGPPPRLCWARRLP